VRPLDAEQDESFGEVVAELSAVVKVHLFERFEDVVQAPQRAPALLILCVDHSDKSL